MQLQWEQHCVAQCKWWWWCGLLIREENIEENKFEKKRIEKECNNFLKWEREDLHFVNFSTKGKYSVTKKSLMNSIVRPFSVDIDDNDNGEDNNYDSVDVDNDYNDVEEESVTK